MNGLNPEDHEHLNHVLDCTAETYAEMRRKYAADPLAQEQIDVYDGRGAPEYHTHFRQLVDAFKASDEAAIATQEAWFAEHYPLITRAAKVGKGEATQ